MVSLSPKLQRSTKCCSTPPSAIAQHLTITPPPQVLHGLPLTGDEKDGLRHTVFYTAQFRADLHAAARSNSLVASEPSTPSARAASTAAQSSESSEDDDVNSADAEGVKSDPPGAG